MGAPAISAPPRRARTQARPRPATKPRPAARPSQKAKARPAAKPRARAAASGRAAAKPANRRSGAASATSRAATPQRRRATVRTRSGMSSAGGVALLPVAAVGGIADCGLVTGMTRSRAWIVVLGLLLGGIVAMNVLGLGLSASSSSVEAKIDSLQRENGVLRTRSAKTLSTEEIQGKAAAMGLALPAPDAIHYLDAHGSDAAKAAKRLAQGLVTVGDPTLASSESDAASTDPAVDAPAAVPPADAVPPIPPDPAVAPVTPVAVAPSAPNPAAATTDPATGAAVAP